MGHPAIRRKDEILDALKKSGGNGVLAAKLLGIPLRTFRRYTKALRIKRKLWAPPESCTQCTAMKAGRERLMRANQRLVMFAKDQGFRFPPIEELRRLYPLPDHLLESHENNSMDFV